MFRSRQSSSGGLILRWSTPSRFLRAERGIQPSLLLPSRTLKFASRSTTQKLRSRTLLCELRTSLVIQTRRRCSIPTPKGNQAQGTSSEPLIGEVAVAPSPSLLRRAGQICVMYMELSKFRLSSLVVITTMVGYYMAPAPFVLDQFIYTTVGTSLAICAANSFNQIIEHRLDLQMDRTMGRMLPAGKMTRRHAVAFGAITGILGSSLLMTQVNMTAGALALGNILLYTLVYTPLKQRHPINTWVGAIVGAIPPLIGWTAATGGTIDGGGLALGSLLFLWQIPHFMSLSYLLKEDYRKAAYKMLSVTNEAAVARAAWYWSLPMLGFGAASAATGMTSWIFALDSIPVNVYLLWLADKFKKQTDHANARKLFFGSIRFLPVLLLLMMFHKTNHVNKDNNSEEGSGEVPSSKVEETKQTTTTP